MTKTIAIESLADWFLSKEPMTHKKLQKLCYYAVAWGWAVMDRGIAQNGRFEAWVHGPVSPTLYKKYQNKGWNDIEKASKPSVPSDIEELLEAVWVTYGAKSGNELEALSHSETPWVKARAGLPKSEICKNEVSTKDMREYYLSIKSTEY